jgi:lipopolysaccharide export system protein LptC
LDTDGLQVFPKLDQARTDDAVTITRAGSILRGRGLRADLAAHRFQLLADVKGRYAPRRH